MRPYWMFSHLLLVACGSGSTPTQPDAPVASEPASVSLVAMPSSVMRGNPVSIAVTLTHFALVNPADSSTPVPGEGHYHVFYDDATTYTAAWTPSFTIASAADSAAGPHTVRVQLVNATHQKLVPIAEATATYTLQ